MKNQTNSLSTDGLRITELNQEELLSLNGGFLPTLALAFGLLGGVALLAYGAGYLYGKLTC